jgi:arsenite-transporting ATPase
VRLVLYTGKGGVGKTTTAAATAVRAAEIGCRTLVVSADSAHSLGDVLEQRLGAEPRRITENLDAVEVDARSELVRKWGAAREFLVELFTHQGMEEVVAEELALLPGAEEIMTLLAVEDFARSGGYDFVVVDCAPTDATLRLVTLPDVANRALRVLLPLMGTLAGVAVPIARSLLTVPLPGGAVFREADALLIDGMRALGARLTGPETTVRMVVTPERMVIEEARRAHTELSLFEMRTDAVVLNRLLPEAAAGEAFFEDWYRVQTERRREIENLFAPLPVLGAPLREDEVTGIEALRSHGGALFSKVDPQDVLCEADRIRYARTGGAVDALIPLPGAEPDRLDVVKVDDELTITSGLRRRSIVLPRRVAPLELVSARLDDGALLVRFEPLESPAPGDEPAQV